MSAELLRVITPTIQAFCAAVIVIALVGLYRENRARWEARHGAYPAPTDPLLLSRAQAETLYHTLSGSLGEYIKYGGEPAELSREILYRPYRTVESFDPFRRPTFERFCVLNRIGVYECEPEEAAR